MTAAYLIGDAVEYNGTVWTVTGRTLTHSARCGCGDPHYDLANTDIECPVVHLDVCGGRLVPVVPRGRIDWMAAHSETPGQAGRFPSLAGLDDLATVKFSMALLKGIRDPGAAAALRNAVNELSEMAGDILREDYERDCG